MPALQDAVAVRPFEFVAAQDGLIIREGDGLGGEAHVHPGGEVFLLARGGLAFAELKDCHVGGVLLLARVERVEVVVGACGREQALARPDIALLLDPAHGGEPSLAVLRGVAGDAVVDEEKEHVGGQAEVLIKPEEEDHRAPKTLTIRQNRTETELPYDSIYYLESDLRKINVYGDVAHQPLCSYYGKLNELPQALFENGFLRVGRSAVVNMKYIRQISSYMVTLRNGVKLGVSRNGYAEIRSTYLEWKGQFGDD